MIGLVARAGLWLIAVLAVVGGAGIPRASADVASTDDVWVLAVDSATGHQVETPSCPDAPAVGSPIEVDSSDWRVFAVRDDGAVIRYAVTAAGELWWLRQEPAGAARSGPVHMCGTLPPGVGGVAGDEKWLDGSGEPRSGAAPPRVLPDASRRVLLPWEWQLPLRITG
jgi:hypothetical protein